MWELEWTFGDRVRKARRVLGLTTSELGDALGMTAQGVSNLEARAGVPRAARSIAAQMELRYQVPSWWLLGHNADPDWRPRQDSNLQPTDDRTDPPADQLAVILPFRHPAQP